MKRLQSNCVERPISLSQVRTDFARILTLFLASQVLWSFPVLSLAQTKPPARSSLQQRGVEAPTETPKIQSQDTVPLTQIVAQMEALTRLLREIEQRLDPGPVLAEIDQTLRRLEAEIEKGKSELEETVAEDPSLAELSDLESEWRDRSHRYSRWQRKLSARIKLLESDLLQLDTQQTQWQATVNSIEKDTTLKEIIERVRNKTAEIQTIRSRIVTQTSEIVLLQNKTSVQDQLVSDTVKQITDAKGRLQRGLLARDRPSLWKTDFSGPTVFEPSYRRGLNRLIQFLKTRPSAIYGPLIIFITVLFLAVEFKQRLPRLATAYLIGDDDLHLFSRPVSLAMLAGLMSPVTLGPSLPVMMRNLIALLLLVPIVRLFLPLIRSVCRPLVYSLAAYVFASAAIEIFAASAPARRVGATALDVAALVIFVLLVRRSRRSDVAFGKRVVLSLVAIRIGLLILLASLVANVLGYAALSHVLRVGALLASYIAVILYTTYRATTAISSVLLRTHLASSIESVRLHREQILRWVARASEVLALFAWLYCSLGFFTIRSEIVDWLASALSTSMSVGKINLSLGAVLAFLLTLFLGVTAAKVIRALLQEDVIPQLSPKHGLPAAVSTLIYYALVTVVFFLALAAGGTDFSRFTVMTGAFGLGVGFGLQTVINNLASGLLLLLERPINVGDVLEVEGMTGVVKRIGMRSSTVRTSQGAEVIVPNTNLITNRVINWTLSERNRRVDIPVGVAYGADPERVIGMLIEVASSHPDVVQDPAPVALFRGFGESSLDFELRFWSPHPNSYQQLKSQVAVGIIVAFRDAGIQIPFPQRELHIKGLDSSITKAVAAERQWPDSAR